MELISTFDLNWKGGTEEGALRVGRSYLDLSSRGVVRLLDIETQVPDWIATPFPGGTEIAGVSLSSDLAVVLATAATGEVRVLDAKSGMPLTGIFRPDGPCRSVEYDAAAELLELSCASVLQRKMTKSEQPIELSTFALDSQRAAERFFATVEDFDLGQYASSSQDEDIPAIQGSVEEFVDATESGG